MLIVTIFTPLLTHDGYFGIHQVANTKVNRLYEELEVSLEIHTSKFTESRQYVCWVGSW